MEHLLDILITHLAEYALPEPETAYCINTQGQEIKALAAWVNEKKAIKPGNKSQSTEVDGWQIWEAFDEQSMQVALASIARSLSIEPNVIRLDFSRVNDLKAAQLFVDAKAEAEKLLLQIQPDHPDYEKCALLIRELRKTIRKMGINDTPKQPEQPKISIPALIYKDAARLSQVPDIDFNIMGFFSPNDETLSAIDALWVTQIRKGEVSVWTACLVGNPAYSEDSSWNALSSEVEMLEQLLDQLEGKATFMWQVSKAMRLLQNWHYRITGNPMTGQQFVDLSLLSQMAFPQVLRSDNPEAMCKLLSIEYMDEMGLGGPLAAMIGLIGKIKESLSYLPEPQRAMLRKVIKSSASVKPKSKQCMDQLLADYWGLAESDVLLDYFIPLTEEIDPSAYLDIVQNHFRAFPDVSQSSTGSRDSKGKTLADFFLKNGYLEQVAGEKYKLREGQYGFSQRIEECLTDSKAYLLEAGTGIGKTIGYLVPVLLSGTKAYVSTNTKALQDQAWQKDVPAVLRAFSLAGIERTVSIIKGKGNYVCLQTATDMLEDAHDYIEHPEDLYFLGALINWLPLTETGWLSEIEHLQNLKLIALLGRDAAPPKLREEWADIDPHAMARETASRSDLVLVNHSYVVSIANAAETSKNEVETLVIDEAHNLDAVVTEVLTKQFRPWVLLHELNSLLKRDDRGEIQGLIRALLANPQLKGNPLLERFKNALDKFETQLNSWCRQARERLNQMYPSIDNIDPDYPASFETKAFWVESLYTSASVLKDAISSLELALHDLIPQLTDVKGLPKRVSGSLGAFEDHLSENDEALKYLFERKPDWVLWGQAKVNVQPGGMPEKDGKLIAWTTELFCTPLDIEGWLRETLNPIYKHKAYVSATITMGGVFDTIKQRLGLSSNDDAKKPITGIYPSPFDFKHQALLTVSHDIPLANPELKIDPLYMEAQSKHIADLAIVAKGRLLALFTSHLIMREMAPRLQARLRDQGILVLTQNDASRAALVERFREAPNKGEKIVLLGVRSFWEGIDVQGEALSVLVVTRLPFEYHGHPVAVAKSQFYEDQGLDRDYFRDMVVPTVFLHLRQMYGRLIRSEQDRGACVITDSRIHFRSYGRSMLQSLPETITVVDKSDKVVSEVEKFLNGEKVESTFDWGSMLDTEQYLSPEQRAIVESKSKRILVRASAGSGKTHVLISRIIRLVRSDDAKPNEVLALTYTNKAMNVMRDRLSRDLKEKSHSLYGNVLTYHKLATRIIRQDDRDQGTETEFLNEKNPEKQKELFEMARKKAGITKDSLSDEDATTLVSYAQNGLVNEDELKKFAASGEKKSITQRFALFYLEYASLLRENNLIDYGEAIIKAVTILRDKKQSQRWGNRFKWIFCDEYQDTSPAQAALLQLLGQQANLFVVGDNNQSIYSWQGSDPENLRRFELDFPNTTPYYLSKNYRCFPKLVKVSYKFLAQAGEESGIKIEYDENRSTEEQNVYYLHNADDKTESRALIGLIQAALNLEIPGDPPPKATVGVLARKWVLLYTLEAELLRSGIPYKFEGDTAIGLLANGKIKDIVIRAARLLERVSSDAEFGDTSEGQIGRDIRSEVITKADVLLKRVLDSVPGKALEEIEKRDFDHLCGVLKDKDATILSAFNVETDKIQLVLSTVHSQKGEEFDTVIVLGMEEGNSPHEPPKAHKRLLEWRKLVQAHSRATWRKELTDEDLKSLYDQEEKRIFYVALTRARHNLIVSRAQKRCLYHNSSRSYEKSCFLDLAHDPKCVIETDDGRKIHLSSAGAAKDASYRYDGRKFQTNSGQKVRSKSEMLLANAFTARGIYYEYEEPDFGVPGALPDFIFPDYGNPVLEHMGMMDDNVYREKWDEKAKRYEARGILLLQTNEQNIMTLEQTIDNLHDQFISHAERRFGRGYLDKIALVEKLRRESDMTILHQVQSSPDLIYEIKTSPIGATLCCIPHPGESSRKPDLETYSGTGIKWRSETINGIQMWLGITTD